MNYNKTKNPRNHLNLTFKNRLKNLTLKTVQHLMCDLGGSIYFPKGMLH